MLGWTASGRRRRPARPARSLCQSSGVGSLSLSTRREAEPNRSSSVVGELDLATVPPLRETAVQALDDPECSTLVLDLEGLSFLDSTGTRVLDRAAQPRRGRRQAAGAGLGAAGGAPDGGDRRAGDGLRARELTRRGPAGTDRRRRRRTPTPSSTRCAASTRTRSGTCCARPATTASPRELHPAFYGCYDWHSAVEMHWALVRLLRVAPVGAPGRARARAVLDEHLTAGGAGPRGRLPAATNPGWERPYGWGWALALVAELEPWDDDVDARALGRPPARPLGDVVARGFVALAAAGRATPNAAARTATRVRAEPGAAARPATAPLRGDPALLDAISEAAVRWFAADVDYPAGWEPSRGGLPVAGPGRGRADRRARPSRPRTSPSGSAVPAAPGRGRPSRCSRRRRSPTPRTGRSPTCTG